ncbi:MAG: beta/gamma crystallin-related protein [Verrucomicrobiota bacterium]
MRQIPKTELSPDNGGIIDVKWKLGSLRYYTDAINEGNTAVVTEAPRMPEIVIYDHECFKGAFARTNLSFNFIGDFWNDRISSIIVVSGVWRFYRDEYYKGHYWELGPGFYESFWTEKGPDDVISSFQAVALT